MKKRLFIILVLMFSLFILEAVGIEFGSSENPAYQLQLARDLHRHNFKEEALELFIRLYYHSKTPKDIKAEALYMMGQVSFELERYETALDDWEILYNDFPEHKLTEDVLTRLADIRNTANRRKKAKISVLDVANDFYRHNFSEIAKQKFLDIYHNPSSSEEDKAEALYLVGQITFEEGNYSVALDDWEILIMKFPESAQTKEIAKRIPQLRDIITSDMEGTVTNVVAQSYMINGDFWSNAERKFTIDSSWMPSLEIAIDWYDKIITEYPGTNDAAIAYQRKMFALLGWKEPGRKGNSFGLQDDFKKYIDQVLKTFNNFEREFPNNSFLQGFRYQIAQAYWADEDWANTRKWLQKVISAGEGEETFYTKTAKARLKKIEY